MAKSQTFFDGRREVPWYTDGFYWKSMVINWAFTQDVRQGRHTEAEFENSLYTAADSWVSPLVEIEGCTWGGNTEAVWEGMREVAGLGLVPVYPD